MLALSLASPLTARAQELAVTLDNGLRAVIVVDRTRPEVATSLTYEVGARDDPAGYSGLAHFAEHCMFEGSLHLGPEQHLQSLETAGATLVNAVTSADFTSFVTVAPREAWRRILWLEAERMAYVLEALDEDAIGRVRVAIRHETLERAGPPPVIMRSIFPEGHPDAEDGSSGLNAIELDDVRWFIQRSYRPDRAVLAIVGDVDASQVLASIHEHFGPIRSHPAEARLPGSPIVVKRRETVYWSVPYSPAPPLYVVWGTPPYPHPQDAALDIVAQLLTRELVRSLPPRQAAGASARVSSGRRGSLFVVALESRDGSTVEQRVAGVEQAVQHVCSGKSGSDVFASERDRFANRFIEQNLLTRAIGLSQDPTQRAMAAPRFKQERYAAVSEAEALLVCRKFLQEGMRLVVASKTGEGRRLTKNGKKRQP